MGTAQTVVAVLCSEGSSSWATRVLRPRYRARLCQFEVLFSICELITLSTLSNPVGKVRFRKSIG